MAQRHTRTQRTDCDGGGGRYRTEEGREFLERQRQLDEFASRNAANALYVRSRDKSWHARMRGARACEAAAARQQHA